MSDQSVYLVGYSASNFARAAMTSRVRDVEKHADEEPSGQRFLNELFDTQASPTSGSLQPVAYNGRILLVNPQVPQLVLPNMPSLKAQKAEQASTEKAP